MIHTSQQLSSCQRTGKIIGIYFGGLVNFSNTFHTSNRLSFMITKCKFLLWRFRCKFALTYCITTKSAVFSGEKHTHSTQKAKPICSRFSLQFSVLFCFTARFHSQPLFFDLGARLVAKNS